MTRARPSRVQVEEVLLRSGDVFIKGAMAVTRPMLAEILMKPANNITNVSIDIGKATSAVYPHLTNALDP